LLSARADYHWYGAAATDAVRAKGGAYWYVGNYDPVYYNERRRYGVIKRRLAPVVYRGPVVDVAVAPPWFRGESSRRSGFAAHGRRRRAGGVGGV